MSIIKVTLFQKNINQDITRDQKVKLISQKSDFVIFPEYFPYTAQWNEKSPTDNSSIYVDRLLEISEYYKGTIIGGSIIREENGKLYHSCPIIKDVALIDWYDIKSVEAQKDRTSVNLTEGQGEGIYILNGVRFGITLGADILREEFLQFYQKEGVEVVFNPLATPLLNNTAEKKQYDKDLEHYAALSKEYALNLVRVCAIGDAFGSSYSGRSLYCGESGI
ncbi:MAG: amidohydrolase, partial [Spirochaetota bacterium]